MTKVIITGWRHGLNKIQLNHLLRQHAGLGLGESKRAVDDLLAGERLTFEFPDAGSASAFCESLNAIGANSNATTEPLVGDPSGSASNR